MSRTTTAPSPNAPTSPVTRVFGAHPFHTDGDLLALGFADDGSLWSVEEPGVLRRWDLDGRRQLGWHRLEELATLWTFGPGARRLASASDDLCVWDVAAGDLAASWPQPCWVTAVAFSPDETLLAAGYDDGAVRLWDWREQRLVARNPRPQKGGQRPGVRPGRPPAGLGRRRQKHLPVGRGNR